MLPYRKLARQEEKEREEEEDIRKASHADSLDQTKIQLEQEKQVSPLFVSTKTNHFPKEKFQHKQHFFLTFFTRL